jgi:hypothetical protein
MPRRYATGHLGLHFVSKRVKVKANIDFSQLNNIKR